ncbi:DJ-1/PfpI family protein [Mariniluteicoccus endophyticus]
MDRTTRLVVVTVFEGVDLLDVTGPPEVFALAKRESAEAEAYEVVLAAADPGAVRTGAGVRVLPDVTFDQLRHRAIDTLVVPGAVAPDAERGRVPVVEPGLVATVAALAERSHRIASVCVGAHVLAAAGLLDGRRATTHWSTADLLAADHPAVEVDPDPIYVRDGNVWTGAGISSCLDLSLALIADDLGEDVALRVARQLVMYLKRPGGQSQFSVPLTRLGTTRRIEELRHHILTHLTDALTVPELAAVAHVGERQLTRLFRSELGVTPHAYVEALRVEHARRLLETGDDTLDRVAAQCGFGSVDTFLRAFRRRVGSTPAEYRGRFSASATG